jgi:hypothetical protein
MMATTSQQMFGNPSATSAYRRLNVGDQYTVALVFESPRDARMGALASP